MNLKPLLKDNDYKKQCLNKDDIKSQPVFKVFHKIINAQ